MAVGENSLERRGCDTKDHALAQWFLKHSETEDMNSLTAVRQQVNRQTLLEVFLVVQSLLRSYFSARDADREAHYVLGIKPFFPVPMVLF